MSGKIQLVIVKNPFSLDKDIYSLAHIPNALLRDYLPKYLPAIPINEFKVSLNGEVIDEAKPDQLIPKPGDYISVVPKIRDGGDDGNKNILASVASIALMVTTGNLANNLIRQGWTTFNAYLAAGAVGMLGGALISSLTPRPKIDIPEFDNAINSPTYGWNKSQPIYGQGGAIGETFGTVQPTPQVLAEHITTDGEKQYLNILLSGGNGPVDFIQDIRINDNPISNYQDVIVETRLGTNDQEPIQFFSDVFADQAFTYELNDSWIAQLTEGNAGEGLEVELELPGGLYYANDQGGLSETAIKVLIEYRPEEGNWVTWGESEIRGAQNTPVRRVYRKDNLTAGRYEVRCKVTYRENTGSRYSNRVVWSRLSQIIYDDFARPGKILVGIRALATNQLSGGRPNITWKQTRVNGHIWNPYTQQYELRPLNNPAWASYDAAHQCRKLKNIHTGEYEYVVRAAPKELMDYNVFLEWANWCTEKGFEVGLFFDSFCDIREAFSRISTLGRGLIVEKGTKISAIFDKPSLPVQLFTVANINKGSFKGEFLKKNDRANCVEVTFWNKEKNYQRDFAFVPGKNYNSAPFKNPTKITLYGCPNYEQAYKEGKYRININDYLLRTNNFEVEIDALAATVGDIVLVQHDVPEWGIGGRVITAASDTVTLDQKIELLANKRYGLLVRLKDDTILEKELMQVAQDTETDIVAVVEPFTQIPEKYDVFSFGEYQKAAKPFKIINITRGEDQKRVVTALEYIEEIYNDDENIPVIDYQTSINKVTNLTVTERVDTGGTTWLDVSWKPPRNDYFGARIEVNGQKLGEVGVDKTSFSFSVSVIQTYNIVITGKNIFGLDMQPTSISYELKPPPPVPSIPFTVTQSGTSLIAEIRKDAAIKELYTYELRLGSSWDSSTLIGKFTGSTYTFDAPSDGTLTFWLKAIDLKGNPAKTATRCIVNVVGLPKKNILFERTEDINAWQVSGVYRAKNGWSLQSQKLLKDYLHFADIFGALPALRSDAQIILPVIDLGENILDAQSFYTDPYGNVKLKSVEKLSDYERFADIFGSSIRYMAPQFAAETFVGVDVKYNLKPGVRVDVEYRTSIDGISYGDWISASIKQFYGRFVQVRLLPISLDGTTPVIVYGAKITIDVPDIEDNLVNIPIPAEKTRIYFHRKFTTTPALGVFTQDSQGKQATYKVSNIATDGFDIELLDENGNLIAGKISRAIARGY